MDENVREPFWLRCGDTTARDRRNLMRLMWVSGAWAASFLSATFLIKKDIVAAGPIAWLLAVLPSLLGVMVMLAYGRYLRETDEMQRKIQFHGLGLGFGVGWFLLCGYPLFARLGAPAADASLFTVVMAVSYSLGVVIAWRRHQ